jgi:hypothetical protein
VRAITCPSCGGSIAIKAVGVTVSLACRHCGTLLDVAQGDAKIIAEYHRAVAELALPLGSRGTIFAVEWEAIGWLEREAGGYVWEEYLRFNPYAGYRWLVVSDGAWQFGLMLTAVPEDLGGGQMGWARRRFEREDEAARITTRKVLGEFYWRVRSGDEVTALSFSSADGQSLSMESTGDEAQWTHLVPVPVAWVRAFVAPEGEALARPDVKRPEPAAAKGGFFSGFAARWRDGSDGQADLWLMGLAGLVTAFVAMLLLGAFGMSTAGLTAKAQVPVDNGSARFTIGTLQVSRAQQFVTVKVTTQAFQNKWVDLDYVLVNKASQQGMPASATVEYYEGYDSDGHWSEGSHEAETRFSAVPAGQYELVVEAQAHNWNGSGAAPVAQPADNPWAVNGIAGPAAAGEVVAIALLFEAGGMPWGLWWLVVVLLALPIGWILAYRRSFTS